MPPRHNYWTIIFGNQPTSFRAATREELVPTFKQIQSKHPDAVMMWFASGRLWRSEEEAQAARFRRDPRPGSDRGGDSRGAPRPDFRGPKPEWQSRAPKPEWRDRPPASDQRNRGPRPEWKDRGPKPEWKPRGPKPEWKD